MSPEVEQLITLRERLNAKKAERHYASERETLALKEIQKLIILQAELDEEIDSLSNQLDRLEREYQ